MEHLTSANGSVAASRRAAPHPDRLATTSFKLNAWPKMYRSASLEPGQIDNLYSELVCALVAGAPVSNRERDRM